MFNFGKNSPAIKHHYLCLKELTPTGGQCDVIIIIKQWSENVRKCSKVVGSSSAMFGNLQKPSVTECSKSLEIFVNWGSVETKISRICMRKEKLLGIGTLYTMCGTNHTTYRVLLCKDSKPMAHARLLTMQCLNNKRTDQYWQQNTMIKCLN